jgi:ABC-type sugar transport system ATPase subunit
VSAQSAQPASLLFSEISALPQVRDLVVQFSVFSNLFLLAQLNKVINSPTIEVRRIVARAGALLKRHGRG